MTDTVLVTSDRFLDPGLPRGEPSSDPFGAERLRVVQRAVQAAAPGLRRLEPRTATHDELLMVHTPEYVTLVREYSEGTRPRDDYRWLSAEVAVRSNTFELASLAAGAVFTAIDEIVGGRARNAVVLARPGDHHAYPARGEGFCVFNHTALGARYLQRAHGLERVLIVDWDVHHGNGTQAIFYADPTVFTFSIHSFGAIYPRSGAATERGAGPGQGYCLNVSIEAGTGDRAYLEAFRRAFRSIRFVPDLVLQVAGFDAHRDDPLGNLRLSEAAFDELTASVREYADRVCGGRLVSVLGGGYNLETIGGLVARHVVGVAG